MTLKTSQIWWKCAFGKSFQILHSKADIVDYRHKWKVPRCLCRRCGDFGIIHVLGKNTYFSKEERHKQRISFFAWFFSFHVLKCDLYTSHNHPLSFYIPITSSSLYLWSRCWQNYPVVRPCFPDKLEWYSFVGEIEERWGEGWGIALHDGWPERTIGRRSMAAPLLPLTLLLTLSSLVGAHPLSFWRLEETGSYWFSLYLDPFWQKVLLSRCLPKHSFTPCL